MDQGRPLPRAAFVIGIALFVGGCGTTQRLYSDKSIGRDQVARIRTKFTQKSGHVTRRVTVESIDAEEINNDKCDWVALLPGTHRIEVSFYKRTDPRGWNIPVTLNLFGAETDVVKARPSEVITSTVNECLSVNVEVGKAYHVTASDDIKKVELTPSVSSLRGIGLGTMFVGSWKPRLVEEP